MKSTLIMFFILLTTLLVDAQHRGDPALTEIWSPVPRLVTPGKTDADPPSDAIVLFRAKKDTAKWVSKDGKPFNWKADDSSFTVVPFSGDLRTKQSFGDCQLHIEWRTPAEVKDSGQGRGNSGVFLMSRYELQVLDSYNNSTYSNGQAGSIYKQHMPMVNVCKPPGEWQTYDIFLQRRNFMKTALLNLPHA